MIESNFAVLERRVAAAQDFSEAERAHDCFLHALVTQSFLSHASLCRQFGEVFGQARRLCGVVARARGGEGIDWKQVEVRGEGGLGCLGCLECLELAVIRGRSTSRQRKRNGRWHAGRGSR